MHMYIYINVLFRVVFSYYFYCIIIVQSYKQNNVPYIYILFAGMILNTFAMRLIIQDAMLIISNQRFVSGI